MVELLHRGAFADEGPSLARLHGFAGDRGLVPTGLHVEVYLTDPGHTPDAELRTLLRVPVRPAAGWPTGRGSCPSARSPICVGSQ